MPFSLGKVPLIWVCIHKKLAAESYPARRSDRFQSHRTNALSAESHNCAGRVEPACHARLTDLAYTRPGVNNSHRDGSREPSIRCATRLPNTRCVHLHSPIRNRCRHNGGTAGMDNPAWNTDPPDERPHKARSC